MFVNALGHMFIVEFLLGFPQSTRYFFPFDRTPVTPEPSAKFSDEALMASPNERSIHLLMGANTRSTAKENRQAKIAKPYMPTPTVMPMAATVQMVAAVVSPCT